MSFGPLLLYAVRGKLRLLYGNCACGVSNTGALPLVDVMGMFHLLLGMYNTAQNMKKVGVRYYKIKMINPFSVDCFHLLLLYPATAWPLDFVMSAPAFGHVDTAVRIIIINMSLSVSLDLVFNSRSTQPCIPPGSLNRVPASAGVRAGMSPLPGGR